jgi:lipopolysaccharide export system permease protein
MILLERYIAVAVLKGVALVTLMLLAVSTFIEFVGQLDDVGTGSYTMGLALSYVALRLPGAVFEFLPAAALIGALLSLGNLAVNRELIVMRASGVSVAQLANAVAIAGGVLMVLMVLLGESLAPSLGAYARELRTSAIDDMAGTVGVQSTWVKSGDRYFRFGDDPPGWGFGGVMLFDVGPDRSLSRIAQADSVSVNGDGDWVLFGYAETAFGRERVAAERAREVVRTFDLSADLLGLSVVREDLLDTPTLQRYIRYLRDNELDASRYLIAFWARVANVASVGLMTLLALPFVFGSLRSAGAGARLLVGLLVGMSYYVAGHTLASGGQVFDVDPRIIAWAPSAVLLLVTTIALARVR